MNSLGVHECVLQSYGVLKTKIQSRKSVSFYPLIWAISQLNRTTSVVWHVHSASPLTFFI